MTQQQFDVELRWAVLVTYKGQTPFLAGRYCWPGATKDEPCKRTFRTRELCRQAIKQMHSYKEYFKPCRVAVRIAAYPPIGKIIR